MRAALGVLLMTLSGQVPNVLLMTKFINANPTSRSR
jgi:hypothetical protein